MKPASLSNVLRWLKERNRRRHHNSKDLNETFLSCIYPLCPWEILNILKPPTLQQFLRTPDSGDIYLQFTGDTQMDIKLGIKRDRMTTSIRLQQWYSAINLGRMVKLNTLILFVRPISAVFASLYYFPNIIPPMPLNYYIDITLLFTFNLTVWQWHFLRSLTARVSIWRGNPFWLIF